ncbi:hypothetical protein [Blastococcus sp. SYSU DS0617]
MINSGRDDVMRRWTLRLTACLVAGCAALTGCSEKQEASRSLPSTSSAAPSKEALPPLGPADFPVPAEARAKTPDGALAFAEYYMMLGVKIGEGRVASDVLLDLSTDECRLCERIARSLAEDRAAGYTYLGNSTTFEELGPPLIDDESAEIGFLFSQSSYTVLDASGQEVPARAGQAAEDLQSGMILIWNSGLSSWLVSNLTVG